MKKNIDDYWELAEYDFKCLEFDYYNKEKKTMPNSLNEKNLDTLLANIPNINKFLDKYGRDVYKRAF